MAKEAKSTDWLAVIGKCLAYLCLENARKEEPKKFDTVAKKVDFLKGMGLPRDDAAYAAGSTPASVAELARRQARKKGARGAAKKKSRR